MTNITIPAKDFKVLDEKAKKYDKLIEFLNSLGLSSLTKDSPPIRISYIEREKIKNIL